MKRLEFCLSVVCSLAASVASAATAMTPEFRLSLKEDAIRVSAGEETLRYSQILETATRVTEFMVYYQSNEKNAIVLHDAEIESLSRKHDTELLHGSADC